MVDVLFHLYWKIEPSQNPHYQNVNGNSKRDKLRWNFWKVCMERADEQQFSIGSLVNISEKLNVNCQALVLVHLQSQSHNSKKDQSWRYNLRYTTHHPPITFKHQYKGQSTPMNWRGSRPDQILRGNYADTSSGRSIRNSGHTEN